MVLPINPAADALEEENAVLMGTGTSYFVPDFEGCLSIKTVVKGSAIYRKPASGPSGWMKETT